MKQTKKQNPKKEADVKVNGNAKFDKNGHIIPVSKKTVKTDPVKKQPVKKEKTDEVNKIFDNFLNKLKDVEYATTNKTTLEKELCLKLDGKIYGYLNPRKYGMGIQRNVGGHWKTERITTVKQAEKALDSIKEHYETIGKVEQIKKQALTPTYRFGDFETTDKNAMKDHLKEIGVIQ